MTCGMRIVTILMSLLVAVTAVRAETLSSVDREALLANLEKLRDAATSKVDARFRLAISAYREAMSNDDTAMALYLRCIEKVNFEAQQKKTTDFLAWKRQDDIKAKLADPAFRLCLRYQLRWLILTLQASSEKANRQSLSIEAQEIVDAIFRDAEKLAGEEKELAQAVTATVFARAYDIGSVEKNQDEDKWPLSPILLNEIYNTIVFPLLRTPARVDSLRSAWIKRIQQEIIQVEAWSNPSNGNGNGKGKPERKIGMAADLKGAEYERFMIKTLPELQWQMEVDLFQSGDESAAAMRMLAHLEKHLNHPSARKWGDQFLNLLKPKPLLAPKAPVGASTE
jgi:hypothetical protein